MSFAVPVVSLLIELGSRRQNLVDSWGGIRMPGIETPLHASTMENSASPQGS